MLFASVVALLAFGLYTQQAEGAFNQQINYQGKLTDSSGAIVSDGDYDMEFALYTVQTGGTAVWTETLTGADQVTVTDGLFSVMLGSSTSLASVDFDQTLYLGVNIESDGEMTPRKVLGAVPAAFEADQVDGLDSTQFLRSDEPDTLASSSVSTLLTINQSGAGDILNLLDDSTEVFTVLDGGNVGIGTSSPYAKLSINGETVASHFTATTTATSTFPTLSVTGLFYDTNGVGGANGEILQTTGSGVDWVSTTSLGFIDTDTNLTEEEVEDFVGTMVTGNTETLISVTYTDGGDGAGILDFVVDNDLSNYDNSSSNFFDTAGTNLNSSGSTVNLDTTLTGLTGITVTNATTTNATTTNLYVLNDVTFAALSGGGFLTTDSNGYLSTTTIDVSDDTNLTATWPIVLTDDTLSWDGIATSSNATAGNLAYWSSVDTLTDVATGTLATDVTGLEFDASRSLVGGAATLSLTNGYTIPLAASTTNWNNFFDTPSTVITAGDALTWSTNTLNFDGGAAPAGELGGTWASPTVDAEITTLEELSDVDTFTQASGDVIYWDGDSWANTATTSWDTDTNLTEEEVEDFVGTMVTGNTETLISVTYTDGGDGAGILDFVVDNDLSNYDNSSSNFFDTAGTNLNSSGSTVNLDTTLTGLTGITVTNATTTNATTTNLYVLNDVTFAALSGGGFLTTDSNGYLSTTTIDVSDDTNLTATWPIVLTDDTLSWDGIATSSNATAGNLAYWSSVDTLTDVATGTLATDVTGLEFDASRSLVGGAATLSLTNGYTIPLAASTTNWNNFFDTPSTVITAGDALTWSTNTLNFDGGAAPAGELGGTWASPTVDAEITTLEELSDVDTFTQASGDVIYWDGDSWANTATTSWDTDTNLTEEEVEDFVGTMVTGNTETLISVTYTDGGDGAGILDFVVDNDLSNYDNSSSNFFDTAGTNLNSSGSTVNLDDEITLTGASTTNATSTNLIVNSSLSLAGEALTAWGGNGVIFNSGVLDFDCSDVTDSSATDGVGCSGEDLVISVDANNFIDDDWGDLSVLSNVVSLDNDVVGTDEIADADFGAFTFSGGSATLDEDTVSSSTLNIANWTDGYVLQASTTASGGFDWVATAALSIDLGDTTGTLGETRGGTGITSYSEGDILYADGANSLVVLTAGSNGDVLKLAGGVPTWGSDNTGGGGGSGLWATTTNDQIVYPADTSDIVVVGSNATSSFDTIFEVQNGNAYFEDFVGIGTTSPATLLNIHTTALSGESTPFEVLRLGWGDDGYNQLEGAGLKISFHTPSGNNSGTTTEAAAVAAVREDGTEGDLRTALTFSVNNNISAGDTFEAMRISSSGNVGIATDTPSHTLSVEGNSTLGDFAVAGYFTATTTATSTFPTLSVTGLFYDTNGVGGANGEILQTTGSGVDWVSTTSLGFIDTDTNLTEEEVEDFVGTMVTGNTETLISVTYTDGGDGAGILDFVVDNDLSNYDNSSSNFFDTAGTNLNSSGSTVNLDTTLTGLTGITVTNATTTNATTTNLYVLNDVTFAALSGGGFLTTDSNGYLSTTTIDVSDDTNLTATWPIVLTDDTLSWDGIATSSNATAGNLAYWSSVDTLTDVATGTLATDVTGLEFDASRSLVGGAATLSLTNGYTIPLAASTTNWNNFFDTPSTVITAGDALTWSTNTLNFDGGAAPAGELGGTWASPTVDAEITTLEELSDVDTFTQASGDVIYWDGDSWANTATTSWDTDTNLTEEEVEDFVGTMVTGNTETLISVTYTDGGDGAGILDFVVDNDLSNYDNSSSNFFDTAGTNLNSSGSTVNLDTTLTGLTGITVTNATTTNATTTNLYVLNDVTFAALSGGGFLTTDSNGYLSTTTIDVSDDTNLTATWPIVLTDDTLSWDGIATSSNATAGNLAYWSSVDTLTDVATGTLATDVTGLEFDASRSLVGGAATLSLTNGYTIPLAASTTNWNNFFDTPSTVITAGDALTWSTNTLNFDGGAAPAGELGGTWASPTVDAEITTLEELSDVDTFTQASGDVIYWDGDSWANTATTSWDTDTNLTEEEVEDFVGTMVTGNTETLISVTYTDGGDGAGILDFVVDNDLSNYDNSSSNFFDTAGTNLNSSGSTVNLDDEITLTGASTTNATSTNLIVNSSLSLAGEALTAWGGNGVIFNSGVLDFDCSDVTDSSATDGVGCSGEDLVISVDANNFIDDDWGDLSVLSNVVSLDNDVVGTDEIADADFGAFTFSGGSATLDEDTVSSSTLNIANWTDGYVLQASTTASGGFDWVATTTLGFGDNTFIGLDDTPGSYTTSAIPYESSGALAFSSTFVFTGSNLGIGDADPVAALTVGDGDDFQVSSTGLVSLPDGSDLAPALRFVADDDLGFYRPTDDTLGIIANSAEVLRIESDGDIVFNQDTNTFISRPTSDQLTLTTGGTEGFRLDDNQRVGINDSDPDFRLEAVGSSGSGYFGLTNSTDGDIFIIDSSGQVGIGTSTPAGILDVVESNDGGATQVFLRNTAPGGSSDETVELTATFNATNINAGKIVFGREGAYGATASQDSFLAFYTTLNSVDTERMRITGQGGDVGINETDPVFRLETVGASASGYFGVTNSTDGDIFIIDSSGQVGIGSTTPGYALTVEGTSSLGINARADSFTATTTATSTFPTLSVTGLFYDTNGVGGASGEVLQTTGSGVDWVSTTTLGFSGGASAIDDLSDVTISSLGDNEILVSSGGSFINQTATEAEALWEGSIDTLDNLTSIQSLTVTLADAGADAVLGWDDTASAYENLTAGEVLTIVGGAANDFDANGDVTIAIADISDLGSNVGTWLGTPSSANLASAVTGETGSGALVFATSPLIVTPDLSGPTLSGKVDADGGAVNDDSCVGEQGLFWYDDTDNQFEFCNDNSGTPDVLGSGGGSSPLTTKGDLYTYDSSDARLAVGSDGQYLVASSTTSTGLAWETVPMGNMSSATFYDNTGGQTLSTSRTVVNLDTELDSSGSVFSLASDVITVSETATYLISYEVGADNGSQTRDSYYAYLQLDTGSGFADIDGSKIAGYTRITGEHTNASGQIIQNLDAGDDLRISAESTGTDGQTTIADATRITLVQLQGPKGDTGDTGPAGSGAGLATSTDIADTYVIYGTSASTVGAEAAFNYDDSTDLLTVGDINVNSLDFTFADAGADAILGWDDTASAYENLTAGEVLTIVGGAANDFDANGDVTIAIADISDLGSNVGTWLGTPSSANLASAVTGETGSGELVFGTSPVLVTPTLSGKVDAGSDPVSDDSCVGEQGLFWYDDTDNQFEFCNDDTGTPDVLGAGGGSVSFGSDNQIPYTNSSTDDFDYSSAFTFDGTDFVNTATSTLATTSIAYLIGPLTIHDERDTNSNEALTIYGNDRSTAANNDAAFASFYLESSSGAQEEAARIGWQASDITSGGFDSSLDFYTYNNGNLKRQFTFNSSGNVVINPDDTNTRLIVEDSEGGQLINVNTASDFVGIGDVANPSNQDGVLHVAGNGSDDVPTLVVQENNSGGTADLVQFHDSSGDVIGVIDDEGQFGIGTATPEVALDITTASTIGILLDNNVWYGGEDPDGNNIGMFRLDSFGNTIFNAPDGAEVRFSIGEGDEKFIMDDDGHVGLNDNGPDYHLEMVGVGSTTNSSGYFGITNSSNGDIFEIDTNGNVGISDQTADLKLEVVGNSTDGYFGVSSVHSNDGDLFIVDENGNVGVGDNNPSEAQFVVNGDIYADVSASVGADPLCWDGSSLSLIGDCTSLAKYKDNIEDLSLGLEDLLALQPREFDWDLGAKDDHDLGFIAEEVAAVSPLLAEYDHETGTLNGVKYSRLTALIVKGMQEQQLTLNDIIAASSTIEMTSSDDTFWSRLAELAGAFVDGTLSLFKIDVQHAQVREELCVDDVCVDADDLRALLDLTGGAASASSSSGGGSGASDTEEDTNSGGSGSDTGTTEDDEDIASTTDDGTTEEDDVTDTETETTEEEPAETEGETAAEETSEETTETTDETEEVADENSGSDSEETVEEEPEPEPTPEPEEPTPTSGE